LKQCHKGSPLFFSEGQGVDGFKTGEVGFSVKSGDITDLIDKIDLIIENYETISEIVICTTILLVRYF
jgi:hypothetical protein